MGNRSLTDTARDLLRNGWSEQDAIDAVTCQASSEAQAKAAVTQAQKKLVDTETFTIPSGLGGVFDVKLIEFLSGGRARVRVHMPRNPDFHGWVMIADADAMDRAKPVQDRVHKICSHCGSFAGHWAQWPNQDNGFGVCASCVTWLQSRDDWPTSNAEEFHRIHGDPGIHYEPAAR